jgi:hypothetical protein
MSNLDIFNLDAESLVTKVPTTGGEKDDFYKPYPENGKDGVYKSLIRFLPNVENPAKSKVHKYYVYLKDPSTGDGFSADCPSTVGKKSILKDIYWKLKNSHSAADQELAKAFSRKEDYYALIQIIQDKNNPELEGKIMIFKFGRKINDMLEAQLQPEYGAPCNPFDLFEGKEFSLNVRKVGEWNNYDLCSFVGEKSPIKVNGKSMQKNKEDMDSILTYLNEGPKNLTSFDYKDWDDDLTNKVMSVIRNSVPEQRVVNEVLSGVSNNTSTSYNSTPSYNSSPGYSKPASNPASDIYEEASQTMVSGHEKPASQPSYNSSPSSLDDLYADL